MFAVCYYIYRWWWRSIVWVYAKRCIINVSDQFQFRILHLQCENAKIWADQWNYSFSLFCWNSPKQKVFFLCQKINEMIDNYAINIWCVHFLIRFEYSLVRSLTANILDLNSIVSNTQCNQITEDQQWVFVKILLFYLRMTIPSKKKLNYCSTEKIPFLLSIFDFNDKKYS